MSLRNRILRNLTAGAFGRLVNALQPLILLPAYLSIWGETLYGEWLLITSVPSFFMLAPDFGIAAVVANRMAMLTGEGDIPAAEDLFRSAFWFLLGCSVTVASIGSIACAFIHWDRLFNLESITPNTAAAIIMILSLQICGQQLANCVVGLYRCALRTDRATYIASAIGLMELVAVIVGLCLGATPLVIVSIGLLARMLALGFYVLDTNRIPNVPHIGFSSIRFNLIRPLWLPALGCGGMPVLQVIQNQVVLTVIGVNLGATSVTLFQSVRTLTNGFRSLFNLLSSAVLMELPHSLGQQQFTAVGKILRRVLLLGTLMAVMALFGTWMFGGWVYDRWTQGKVSYDSALCLTLTFATLPYVLGTPASIFLHAANRLHATIPLSLVSILFSLMVMVPLMPMFGIAAAGYSMVIWEVLNAAILTWYFRQFSPEVWSVFITRSAQLRRPFQFGFRSFFHQAVSEPVKSINRTATHDADIE